MTASHPLLKAAALVGAVLCVGTFVGYRAGLIPTRTPTAAAPAPEQPSATPPEPDDASNAFLGGSKSAAVFKPGEVTPVPPGATFLGGSKSIVIAPPPAGAAPPAPQPAPNAPKP